MNGAHDPEALERHVEGALSGEARRRLEAHLEGCADCAGQVRLARRVRAALADGRKTDGLSTAELAELSRRLRSAIAVPAPALSAWRWPAWAAVGAVAALALWVSRPAVESSAGAGARPAERAPRAASAAALRRAEAGLVADAVGASASLFGGTAPVLTPVLIAHFGTSAGFGGVVVGGAPGPAFATAMRGGRRALVLSGISGSADPARLEIAVPAGTGPVEAVSVWVWADTAVAEISLEVADEQGQVREIPPRRAVAPGQWMLVTFPLPDDISSSPIARLGFGVAGPAGGDRCTVALDRMEVWRHAR
ncbi:MAG: zf-HC2 domain-containing protein [Candidatus Coatesbacteria bacterium]